MIELNLPPYPYKVKQEKDKILIFGLFLLGWIAIMSLVHRIKEITGS